MHTRTDELVTGHEIINMQENYLKTNLKMWTEPNLL